MPKQWFLMPDRGPRGQCSDVVEAFVDGMGVLVNASRSIIYAEDPVAASARADSIFVGGISMKRFGTILLVGVAVLLLVPAFHGSSLISTRLLAWW